MSYLLCISSKRKYLMLEQNNGEENVGLYCLIRHVCVLRHEKIWET
jgi:hypothetical protein